MIIFVILITLVLFVYFKTDKEFEGWMSSFVFLFLELGVVFCLIDGVVNERVIDNKIELLEKQNTEIEEKVELTVKTYMAFEKDTLKEFKIGSYMQIANLYPDLKSNELIQSQINLYEKNNEKILELMNEKADISNYKWWLYFGR